MKIYALVLLIVAVTVYADYLLKLASERSGWLASVEFGAGTLLYAATAAGWVIAMRHMSLAHIAVAYSVMMILFLAALGALVFRETLTTRDMLGIACAVAALGLMSHS